MRKAVRIVAAVLADSGRLSSLHAARRTDQRSVVPDREAKSASHETTFAEDIEDTEALQAWALELTEQVVRRLRRHHPRGRTVQLKVRFSDFRTITRATTLARPTNVTQEIWQVAREMLAARLPTGHLAVRLLGVGMSGIVHSEQTQLSLFPDETNLIQADRPLNLGEISRCNDGKEEGSNCQKSVQWKTAEAGIRRTSEVDPGEEAVERNRRPVAIVCRLPGWNSEI